MDGVFAEHKGAKLAILPVHHLEGLHRFFKINNNEEGSADWRAHWTDAQMTIGRYFVSKLQLLMTPNIQAS
jgi:hypothetical protein